MSRIDCSPKFTSLSKILPYSLFPRSSMKHQNPKPLKPSNAPPSSKVAVYDGIGIALVVLNYLLDDHPRHIRYRENQKQPQAPKPYRNHAPIRETIPPPPSRPRSPFIEIHPRPPSPPLRRRKSSFSRNDAPREHRPRQRRPEEFSTPFRPDTSPYYPVHPSRSEMHSAWSRIRAVTPSTLLA